MTITDLDLRERIAGELERTRRRSAVLTESVDEDDLVRQHSPLMSPLVWDLAHIGNQEELWLVRDVGGREPVRQDIDELYDAFRHPRGDRPQLPLLGPAEARRYVATVRDKVFDVLDGVPLEGQPLVDSGFAFGMILQHEQQHDETMVATHQLRDGAPALHAPPPPPAPGEPLPAEVLIPAGAFTMGTSTEPWALDNERPAHAASTDAYWIDTTPVSNADYEAFIAAGGYDDERWWSDAGWAHRVEAGLEAPLFWERDGDGWARRRFGVHEPVPPSEPVQHVSFYEAEAYARWAGKRLPTEAEWEKAARWDPESGRSRRYPWGDEDPTDEHANLGQRHLQPAPVGSYPAGASPLGVRQLIGDVWEWTSSTFAGYPGFAAFPYREYSEVFFGPRFQMLRGGSWATDKLACRGTFRNWDYPIRRHLAFLGPPTPIGALLVDPPHSLVKQSWAPRRQRYGTVNADGFGIGWYADGDPEPARYRSDRPMWTDPFVRDLGRVVRTTALLAAVRSGTEGMPYGEAAAAPFAEGSFLFSHNGAVPGWPASIAPLAVTLHPADVLSLEAPTDSALLWLLVRERLRTDPDAIADALVSVVQVASATGGGRLNLLVTDGRSIAATTWGDTLSWRADQRGVVVASEPFDDEPGWHDVPDRSLLTATPDGVAVVPLPDID